MLDLPGLRFLQSAPYHKLPSVDEEFEHNAPKKIGPPATDTVQSPTELPNEIHALIGEFLPTASDISNYRRTQKQAYYVRQLRFRQRELACKEIEHRYFAACQTNDSRGRTKAVMRAKAMLSHMDGYMTRYIPRELPTQPSMLKKFYQAMEQRAKRNTYHRLPQADDSEVSVVTLRDDEDHRHLTTQYNAILRKLTPIASDKEYQGFEDSDYQAITDPEIVQKMKAHVQNMPTLSLLPPQEAIQASSSIAPLARSLIRGDAYRFAHHQQRPKYTGNREIYLQKHKEHLISYLQQSKTMFADKHYIETFLPALAKMANTQFERQGLLDALHHCEPLAERRVPMLNVLSEKIHLEEIYPLLRAFPNKPTASATPGLAALIQRFSVSFAENNEHFLDAATSIVQNLAPTLENVQHLNTIIGRFASHPPHQLRITQSATQPLQLARLDWWGAPQHMRDRARQRIPVHPLFQEEYLQKEAAFASLSEELQVQEACNLRDQFPFHPDYAILVHALAESLPTDQEGFALLKRTQTNLDNIDLLHTLAYYRRDYANETAFAVLRRLLTEMQQHDGPHDAYLSLMNKISMGYADRNDSNATRVFDVLPKTQEFLPWLHRIEGKIFAMNARREARDMVPREEAFAKLRYDLSVSPTLAQSIQLAAHGVSAASALGEGLGAGFNAARVRMGTPPYRLITIPQPAINTMMVLMFASPAVFAGRRLANTLGPTFLAAKYRYEARMRQPQTTPLLDEHAFELASLSSRDSSDRYSDFV